jgi:predicted O-methyltransferase YrrM
MVPISSHLNRAADFISRSAGLIQKRQKSPVFTSDWFTQSRDSAWLDALAPYRGRAVVRYLEVGAYEGRSLLWMLEEILTHPSAKAFVVDAMIPPFSQRLKANLLHSSHGKKVTLFQGMSERVLREFPEAYFDIIYLDGAHDVRTVMIDAVNSWYALKPGGLLIFDDYLLEENRFPPDLFPKLAVDTFIAGLNCELEILYKGYQVIVRKLQVPLYRAHSETRFGDYLYDWYASELSHLDVKRRRFRSTFEKKKIELSQEERSLLETCLAKSVNGGRGLTIPAELHGSAVLNALVARLDIANS